MDLKKEIMDDIEKAQLSAEEILRKYDKESDKRELTGVWNTIINVICIVFFVFCIFPNAAVYTWKIQKTMHSPSGRSLSVDLLFPLFPKRNFVFQI